MIDLTEKTRVCNTCKLEKPVEKFRIKHNCSKIKPDSYRARKCIDCQRLENMVRNLEKKLAQQEAKAIELANETSRTCMECKVEKPIGGFYLEKDRNGNPSHYRKICIECRNAARKYMPPSKPKDTVCKTTIETTKICNTCGIKKSIERFATDKRVKGNIYVRPRCKDCDRIAQNAGRLKKRTPHKETKAAKAIELASRTSQVCNTCHIEKPNERFKLRKETRRDGSTYYRLSVKCKDCANAVQKAHLQNDPEARQRSRDSANRFNHKVRENITIETWSKIRHKDNKKRAENHGIKFTATVPDFIAAYPKDEKCPALGIPLIISSNQNPNSPSIDRFVPEFGYTPGNLNVVSRKANTIKNDGTPEEVMAVALWMKAKAEQRYRENLAAGHTIEIFDCCR